MSLLIDRRNGSIELAPYLARMGAKTEVTELEFGDFAFEGNGEHGTAFIGIERKTLGDLLACISSGRFSGHQLPGMVEMYDYQYLIVEGMYRSGDGGLLEEYNLSKRSWYAVLHGRRQYTYAEVDRWIGTIEVHTPFKVRRAYGMQETAAQLVSMYHRWRSKKWDEHRSHLAFNIASGKPKAGPISFRKPSLVQCIAKELPGVGWDRSLAISRSFATVDEMVKASPKRWMEIEGIGKGMATKIVDALKGGKG
jgi:ERCC4-type nuclease